MHKSDHVTATLQPQSRQHTHRRGAHVRVLEDRTLHWCDYSASCRSHRPSASHGAGHQNSRTVTAAVWCRKLPPPALGQGRPASTPRPLNPRCMRGRKRGLKSVAHACLIAAWSTSRERDYIDKTRHKTHPPNLALCQSTCCSTSPATTLPLAPPSHMTITYKHVKSTSIAPEEEGFLGPSCAAAARSLCRWIDTCQGCAAVVRPSSPLSGRAVTVPWNAQHTPAATPRAPWRSVRRRGSERLVASAPTLGDINPEARFLCGFAHTANPRFHRSLI